jgi:hypothetical protein
MVTVLGAENFSPALKQNNGSKGVEICINAWVIFS